MAIDLNEKVVVKNLCSWGIGFPRINSNGDVSIMPHGQITLTADEIQAQCYANNKLLVGNDGKGSHASAYINNKDLRIELDFESADEKESQNIIDEDKVKALFELKTLTTFKKRFEETIVTDAEKALVVDLIKKLKINDYDKIKYVESYTGYKVD